MGWIVFILFVIVMCVMMFPCEQPRAHSLDIEEDIKRRKLAEEALNDIRRVIIKEREESND